MYVFVVRGGRFTIAPQSKARAHVFASDPANEGTVFDSTQRIPDSKKQRGFYHGAVIPLWAYLDGKDYTDHRVLNDLHEVAKMESNGIVIVVNGEPRKIGRTTSGKLRDGYIDRVIAYLEQNYGIDRMACLNPEDYKRFMAEVYSFGKYETYIDYMIDVGTLPKREEINS